MGFISSLDKVLGISQPTHCFETRVCFGALDRVPAHHRQSPDLCGKGALGKGIQGVAGQWLDRVLRIGTERLDSEGISFLRVSESAGSGIGRVQTAGPADGRRRRGAAGTGAPSRGRITKAVCTTLEIGETVSRAARRGTTPVANIQSARCT